MNAALQKEHTTAERIRIEQDFDELLSVSERCKTNEHVQIIRKAFEVADEAHIPQRRKVNGEPYIHHPIAVAKIIGKLGLGPKTIAAALLHDVVEDNPAYTIEFIQQEFGEEVATMVDGLTKIPEAKTNSDESVQIATFRHLLETIPNNIRTVFVKIADRLHNMKTMEGMPPRTQHVKSSEAIQVYVPIAKRLGLYSIKNQLEDLSFRYINPDMFRSMQEKVDQSNEERSKVFNHLKDQIDATLSRYKIDYQIKYRQKSNWSAYKLMQNKDLHFDQIEEFMSLRIVFSPNGPQSERIQAWGIYSRLTDCLVNNTSMLKDYSHEIMLNGYRALHFALMGSNQHWIQVQVLSKRWEQISESGFIIDRQYSEGNIQNSKLSGWINSLKDSLESATTNKAFLAAIETDMFVAPIQCFTPKGKIVNLPENSTVLDFAFQVHSQVGLHCISAIVNHRRVGRDYILSNSDRVEIETKTDHWPDQSWYNNINTPKARNELKNYFYKKSIKIKEEGRRRYITMLDVQGIDLEISLTQKIFNGLSCISEEEFYFNLGNNKINDTQLQHEIKRFTRKSWLPKFLQTVGEEAVEIPGDLEFHPKKPFVVSDDLDETKYSLAACCNPISGDNGLAHKTPRGLIVIHRNRCHEAQRISATYGKKIAQVEWSPNMQRSFLTKFQISGQDRSDLLIDVLSRLKAHANLNLCSVDIKGNEGVFYGTVSLQVPNAEFLKAILREIGSIQDIKEIRRLEKF